MACSPQHYITASVVQALVLMGCYNVFSTCEAPQQGLTAPP